MNSLALVPAQVCNRCVMDESSRVIYFDQFGNCNYCESFFNFGNLKNDGTRKNSAELTDVIRRIKFKGRERRYDCIVGVSGGVDSAYLLLKAVDLGLRPLVVHMDNNWNSELAQNNISQLVRRLDLDMETYVIRWPEYRALMQSFLDADVIDIELLYDNAVMGVTNRMARKHGIQVILNGTNRSTEGMPMPRAWNWYKSDARNIRAIAKEHGVKEFQSFPFSSTLDIFKRKYVWRIEVVPLLDLLGYNKDNALDLLVTNYGFKPYPYKHYESIFTRFYQGFLLPTKFGVDKRRQHLSNLIVTGQIDRERALSELNLDPYVTPMELFRDKRFFLKKMGWSNADLDEYLARQERSHGDFPNERKYLDFAIRLRNSIKRRGRKVT